MIWRSMTRRPCRPTGKPRIRLVAYGSNCGADRLAEALAISEAQRLPRYETLQPWYNLYDRVGFEGDLPRFAAARASA